MTRAERVEALAVAVTTATETPRVRHQIGLTGKAFQ